MNVWAGVVTVLGTVATLIAAAFTARSAIRAAASTAEATKAAAKAQAEPAQRERDLAAFQAIRDDMQQQVRDLKAETGHLRQIVRAFASYVGELTMQMQRAGVQPPPPPELVDEYNRTGV
jgi:flagellar biosynthesis/type III secretory pathway M-ring protein FliF/YscJ